MQRVVGVDVARGLAILGMFTAHLGDDDAARLPNGASWLEAADGRSAAMFALLAGVSAGFISGGAAPTETYRARVRILVRAAVLLPLGVFLAALGTPIAVILPSYAVMFAMLTVALAWRPRTLLVAAAVVLLVAPPIVFVARDAPAGGDFGLLGYPAELLTGEFYPALVWIAYLLVGLALARLDLTDPQMPRRLLLWGLPLAVAGYGAGAVAVRTIPETSRRALLDASPHADSAVEVVGNIGVVLCVLAACLVIAAHVPRLIAPVAATGALALTAYTVQILVIAGLGDDVVRQPSNLRLAAFIVVTLVAAMLWRHFLGRGPLESALHRSSTWVADQLVPDTATPLGTPAIRSTPATRSTPALLGTPATRSTPAPRSTAEPDLDAP